jgi:6-pyruvoyltetrahydropterin/6-carboxytetrahydropterin synthase
MVKQKRETRPLPGLIDPALIFRGPAGYTKRMFSARVEAEFAAAHFLSHYHGKCENLHGHNYRVRLWIRGETLDEGGMLADFALLKKALREVLSGLDHTSLNDNPVFKNDPSAERIARYIFENLESALPALSVNPALLWAVEVYETSVNMARYEKG